VVKALSDSSSVTQLGAAALGALGLIVLFFAEFEQLLELVGIGYVLQFLVRKLLFAEQREKTLDDVRIFLDEKVAAQEAGKDLRRLADAVLEVDTFASMDEVTEKAAADAQRLAQAAAVVSKDVPENVQSARAWIGNWRAKSQAQVPVHA
jgi:chitinase domain-containing protein 1